MESEQFRMEVLVDLKRRGLKTAPELCIRDGALSFWKALGMAYETARWQRCWVHKAANVLNRLPKSIQAKARNDCIRFGWRTINKEAKNNFDAFVQKRETKYHKALRMFAKGS